jgi:hypothetical protein
MEEMFNLIQMKGLRELLRLGHIDPAGYRSGFFAVARHLQKVWGVEGDLQMPPEEQDEYGEYSRSRA